EAEQERVEQDRVPRPDPSQGRPDGERAAVIRPDHRHGAARGAAGAGLAQVVAPVAERDPDGADRGGSAGEAGRGCGDDRRWALVAVGRRGPGAPLDLRPGDLYVLVAAHRAHAVAHEAVVERRQRLGGPRLAAVRGDDAAQVQGDHVGGGLQVASQRPLAAEVHREGGHQDQDREHDRDDRDDRAAIAPPARLGGRSGSNRHSLSLTTELARRVSGRKGSIIGSGASSGCPARSYSRRTVTPSGSSLPAYPFESGTSRRSSQPGATSQSWIWTMQVIPSPLLQVRLSSLTASSVASTAASRRLSLAPSVVEGRATAAARAPSAAARVMSCLKLSSSP